MNKWFLLGNKKDREGFGSWSALFLRICVWLYIFSPIEVFAMSLAVDGTEFVLTMPDGKQLRSNDLVGANLQMPDGSIIKIDAVEKETLSDGTEIWLHNFLVKTSAGWQKLCQPDSNQRTLGFPFPGAFDQQGRYVNRKDLFNLSCTSGAQGKCIRFGYAPWKKKANGGDFAEYYSACIRMVRADYCGDQKGNTVNGTPIDIYDDLGIQKIDLSINEMRFEAGWASDGAVCASHLRVPTLPDPRSCPRLEGKPQGKACTEEWARKHGALLFNRSKETSVGKK